MCPISDLGGMTLPPRFHVQCGVPFSNPCAKVVHAHTQRFRFRLDGPVSPVSASRAPLADGGVVPQCIARWACACTRRARSSPRPRRTCGWWARIGREGSAVPRFVRSHRVDARAPHIALITPQWHTMHTLSSGRLASSCVRKVRARQVSASASALCGCASRGTCAG